MIDAAAFSADAYLAHLASTYDLGTTAGRKLATCTDPLAFALLYLPELVSDEAGRITFAEAHFEWVDKAKQWITGAPSRDCYVAPRGLGKSSWWFGMLPIWAAAFGYVHYIAAFSSSASQAWTHLANFKRQMDTNELLRQDFPDLCNPKRRPNGRPVADSEGRYIANSGFVFDADGIDSSVAGKNVGGKRPDLLLLDDIEPDESNYSLGQVDKRLSTLLDNIFYLNVAARVVLVGTVTMPGSIIHQLVRSLTEEPEQWIADLRPPMHVHHHLPILTNDDGSERSIWPGNTLRFDLEQMQAVRTTAHFLKNYMNSPMGGDGSLWTVEDFRHRSVEGVGGLLLSIDGAVTSKSQSDYTGLALVGWSKSEKVGVVEECWAVRLSPERLRARVIEICESYPVVAVLVETNQGGDLWATILKDLPVPLRTVHQTESKELRAGRVYTLYSKGLVVHTKRLGQLEEQMVGFPKAPHDDMVDAVTSGIRYLVNSIKTKKQTRSRPLVSQRTYLGAS